MLEKSGEEESCREVLEKSVERKCRREALILYRSVVEKTVLEKRVVEECCREVLERSVVEKCCKEVLWRSVRAVCCREVL